MRVIVLTPEIEQRITEVVAFATENPESTHSLWRRLKRPEAKAPGDDPRHVVKFPGGLRAVFSVEQQPAGLMRHLSLSIDTPGRTPNPALAEVLMEKFGFRGGIRSLHSVHEEDIGDGRKAVSLLQLVT